MPAPRGVGDRRPAGRATSYPRLLAGCLLVLLALAGLAALAGLQGGWLRVEGLAVREGRSVGAPGGPVTAVSGQRGYFSGFIPVDPERRYRLSGLFRTSSEHAGMGNLSGVYLGLRLYDAQRRALVDGAGAYRYPAARGTPLTGLEGWVRVSGEISGVAETGDTAFRPGTAFVRVVVVPGYGTSDVVTEIADIAFAEIVRLEGIEAEGEGGEGN